jgi:flavodoxin I
VKTLVLYDSVYGNTEKIAQAIGAALPGPVEVLRVTRVTAGDLVGVELLIVGSPTHGAMPTDTTQRLIERIGAPDIAGGRAATFDTRFGWKIARNWGFAAPRMADALLEKGWSLAASPEGFIVRGLRRGPLKQGETERAAAWARTLVQTPA